MHTKRRRGYRSRTYFSHCNAQKSARRERDSRYSTPDETKPKAKRTYSSINLADLSIRVLALVIIIGLIGFYALASYAMSDMSAPERLEVVRITAGALNTVVQIVSDTIVRVLEIVGYTPTPSPGQFS